MDLLTQNAGLVAPTGVAVLVAYVTLCRGFRFLRRDMKHAHYPYETREEFKNMTAEHAYEIVQYVQGLEFPFIATKVLAFALFRTYGIPSISKLLCETQQLGKVEYAGRRYADTAILITEFLGHSPTSERHNSAIARMNYLHGRYQKAGKISNDDMLFTLSLFVTEVERWARLYEWRQLSLMEICATGTYWKCIGDAMGIDFSSLRHGPDSFRDGLEFFEDIKQWAEDYEIQYMVPNKWNHQLAEETSAILLTDVPKPMKPMAKNFVKVLMDDRLRKSMMYDDPPPVYAYIIQTIFAVRKFVTIWLMPPRPYALRYDPVSPKPDPNTGRYHMSDYDGQPWYVKSTFFTRNSPTAWLRWIIGGPHPGDGKQYKSEGYKIFELGPTKLENHGIAECESTRDRLMSSDRGGCPFAFAK
ncbi:hypothetical protein HBI73_177100 [Parastagonospora nodorum]|nr:hypothetical protein HBI73_177100 [Parastagonospora nodorum]KAH5672523.1 hypothetical protein HBI21_164710 [Parastagonospora nodorum]